MSQGKVDSTVKSVAASFCCALVVIISSLARRSRAYDTQRWPFQGCRPALYSGDCHSRAPSILQRLPFWPLPFLQRLPFSSAYHPPATAILQRLAFSSAYHPPATTILQRPPFSSDYTYSSDRHSPAPTILQRLPISSAYHSPATAILQRLPSFSAYHTPATAILQRLPYSSDCHSPATAILQRLPATAHSLAPAILLATTTSPAIVGLVQRSPRYYLRYVASMFSS
jgi:hypothetical protein